MNQHHKTMEIHELATAFSACMRINTQYSEWQFQQKFGFLGNFMQIVSAQQNSLHEMSNPISEKVRQNFLSSAEFNRRVVTVKYHFSYDKFILLTCLWYLNCVLEIHLHQSRIWIHMHNHYSTTPNRKQTYDICN